MNAPHSEDFVVIPRATVEQAKHFMDMLRNRLLIEHSAVHDPEDRKLGRELLTLIEVTKRGLK